MGKYIDGATIRNLRERSGRTQKELAELLNVSDKAVSKWETGNGLPDISLVQPLAEALGVSVTELFSGQQVVNSNRSGNLRRSKFYVCPLCGNVIHALGDSLISCCGVALPPLEAEAPADEHEFHLEPVEDEYYLTLSHPMTREHYISFVAYIGFDRLQLIKLYPEQDAAVRIPKRGHGTVYVYCNRHGLFSQRI